MSENDEFQVYTPFRSVKDDDFLLENKLEVPAEVRALNILQPLKFVPFLSKRPWGGKRLSTILGKKIPADETIGESWEISGHSSAESLVKDGVLKGFKLNDIMRIWGEKMLGKDVKSAPDNIFPLLTKFIDSNANLSVQVHPGDTLDEHGSVVAWGKTETWFIIDATADAYVYQGFTRDVTQQEVKERVEAGTIEEILHKIPVKAGDVVVNPATVVHSIGAGILLYEVQQVSDATYRLYDFGRKGRELHIDEALQVMYLKQGIPAESQQPKHLTGALTKLAETEYFELFEITVQHDRIISLTGLPTNKCYLTHCVRGDAKLQAGEFAVDLRIGESALIPACLTPLKSIAGTAKLILSVLK